MMDGMMMQPEGPVGEGGEAPEQETTCVCPNCGATLKIEVEGPEEAAPAGDSGPSIREALTGAMGV